MLLCCSPTSTRLIHFRLLGFWLWHLSWTIAAALHTQKFHRLEVFPRAQQKHSSPASLTAWLCLAHKDWHFKKRQTAEANTANPQFASDSGAQVIDRRRFPAFLQWIKRIWLIYVARFCHSILWQTTFQLETRMTLKIGPWWWKPEAFGTPFFPTSQVRVVRFYHSCSSPPSPLPPPRQSSSPTSSPILIAKLLANPLRQLLIAVGTAGPQLPASDRSGHPWTSTASVSSQWASLGLNRQRRIPVGTPGPQPPASDLSGHPWTSTTRFYHQTLSESIITKDHHKASSQYIITKHHHRPSSQIIITDHLHKTSSQYIITKHHHKSLSQIIDTWVAKVSTWVAKLGRRGFTRSSLTYQKAHCVEAAPSCQMLSRVITKQHHETVLIQCLNAMVGITRSKIILDSRAYTFLRRMAFLNKGGKI